ncbi:MAG: methylenetetrahydrofolate reductase [Proteobacteria bacterium]|nr:methylenetetrahydrofolate reductase [Pseudomonadota bacterium]MBU1740924.1 methylenetetrahydrofolate reductase [Pseudomonadota bacterium]
MSKFEETLGQKDFVVTVELDPPKGTDLGPLLDVAQKMRGKVDAVIISDNQGATARMSPLPPARALAGDGWDVVWTLTCRDRNRLALTSDLLGAASLGLDNVLLVTGDFVSLGDHPDAKPVFDLDSVQALQLAAALAEGRDLAGHEVAAPRPFFPGAVASPGAAPLGPQLMKLHKKVAAGARFIITRPVGDRAELETFVGQAGAIEVKVLAGVEAGDPMDAAAAAALFQEIKSSGLVAGVHLSASGGADELLELVSACGL